MCTAIDHNKMSSYSSTARIFFKDCANWCRLK